MFRVGSAHQVCIRDFTGAVGTRRALSPLVSARPVWLFICIATKSLTLTEGLIQFVKYIISVQVDM